MATPEQAVSFFQKYLLEKGLVDEFKRFNYSQKVEFSNEYLEYTITERHESGFIELGNVEIGNETVFSFYCPNNYADFKTVMSILKI